MYQSLNYIFHKTIKIQICLFSLNLVILLHLEHYEINMILIFLQIIKDISNPLYSIYKNFIQEEISNIYFKLFTNNLRPGFEEDFNKLFKIQRFTQNLKKSELIILILKQLDKGINILKYYSDLNLKNSALSTFNEAFIQLLSSLENKTLNQFMDITFNTLLYSELYGVLPMNNSISSNLRKDVSNNQMDSPFVNRINSYPPLLPSINQKYKYTLVLDLEGTLIHYFSPDIGGSIFFVRPYFFEFLKELNDLYEIITFTTGTLEIDDLVLNWLDKDNKFIKYRLFELHMNFIGTDPFKDLNFIGRDLSKVIIIDILKENFRFHPYNGFLIKPWINDINDLELKDLSKILKDIVTLKVNDVRPVIRKINDEINNGTNGKRPYKNINVEKLIGIDKNEVLIPKQEVEIPNNDLAMKNNIEENKDNKSNIVNSENINNLNQPEIKEEQRINLKLKVEEPKE